MGEFLQGKPLFPGKTEQEQCKLIFKVGFQLCLGVRRSFIPDPITDVSTLESLEFPSKSEILNQAQLRIAFRNLEPQMTTSGRAFPSCHTRRKSTGSVTEETCCGSATRTK